MRQKTLWDESSGDWTTQCTTTSSLQPVSLSAGVSREWLHSRWEEEKEVEVSEFFASFSRSTLICHTWHAPVGVGKQCYEPWRPFPLLPYLQWQLSRAIKVYRLYTPRRFQGVHICHASDVLCIVSAETRLLRCLIRDSTDHARFTEDSSSNGTKLQSLASN